MFSINTHRLALLVLCIQVFGQTPTGDNIRSQVTSFYTHPKRIQHRLQKRAPSDAEVDISINIPALRTCEKVYINFTAPALPKSCGFFAEGSDSFLEVRTLESRFDNQTAGSFSWVVDFPAGLKISAMMYAINEQGNVISATTPIIEIEKGNNNSCIATNPGQNTASIVSIAKSLDPNYAYTGTELSTTSSTSTATVAPKPASYNAIETPTLVGIIVGGVIGSILAVVGLFFLFRKSKPLPSSNASQALSRATSMRSSSTATGLLYRRPVYQMGSEATSFSNGLMNPPPGSMVSFGAQSVMAPTYIGSVVSPSYIGNTQFPLPTPSNGSSHSIRHMPSMVSTAVSSPASIQHAAIHHFASISQISSNNQYQMQSPMPTQVFSPGTEVSTMSPDSPISSGFHAHSDYASTHSTSHPVSQGGTQASLAPGPVNLNGANYSIASAQNGYPRRVPPSPLGTLPEPME